MANQKPKQYRCKREGFDYLTAKGEWKHVGYGEVVDDLLPQTAAWAVPDDFEEVTADEQAPADQGGEG